MCLAQGHNKVMPLKLEPATPQSRVKHSTTGLPFPKSELLLNKSLLDLIDLNNLISEICLDHNNSVLERMWCI